MNKNNITTSQALKQQCLGKLQEKYHPVSKEDFYDKRLYSSPFYIKTSDYPHKSDSVFKYDEDFVVKNSSQYYAFLLTFSIIFLVGSLVGAFSQKNGGWFFGLAALILLLMAVHFIIQLCSKKPPLIINKLGLYFNEKKIFISWAYIIATHIRSTIAEDCRNEMLVVDYIESDTANCTDQEFDIIGVDKDADDIVAAVEFFRKQYDLQVILI